MKIAINKKYKYLTFEEHCPENENFEKWVMQDKFETHSVIEIPDDVDKEKLRFDQFDYDAKTDTFVFNREKYNEFLNELNKPVEPTETDLMRDCILEIDYRLILLELDI